MAFELTGDYTAYIYDRGGMVRLFPIKGFDKLTFGRIKDAISTAAISVPTDKLDSQHANLASIRTGRHELVIFREQERMWEGPITLIPSVRGSFGLEAKDTLHYWNRTVMHARYSSAYPHNEYATARIKRIALAELARKEGLGYNLTSHIHNHQWTTDAKTSAVTDRYSQYLWSHLDELAARGGIDYTMVGRGFHMWDTSRAPFGQMQKVTENDFIGDINVTEYGVELATLNVVTDGQGGVATLGGNDPYYGEIELLYNAYNATTGGPLPTQQALVDQAKRNSFGRNPAPVVINIPASTQINPKGVWQIDDLVPGRFAPIVARLNVREISQMHRIDKVDWTIDASGESITADLITTASPDDADGVQL
jgi:hypothetical protein